MTEFWKTIPLSEMSESQWESLCDGCGKCCVLKLEDADSGTIYATDVACRLLDCNTARCTNYADRKAHVPDCVILTPDNLAALGWMPKSCAYRCLHEGRDLPQWHPLKTGTQQSVVASGHCVAGKLWPEDMIADADMIDHITDWG